MDSNSKIWKHINNVLKKDKGKNTDIKLNDILDSVDQNKDIYLFIPGPFI